MKERDGGKKEGKGRLRKGGGGRRRGRKKGGVENGFISLYHHLIDKGVNI